MKTASYENRNKSARRGAQFVPIGMPTVMLKNAPTKQNKYVNNQKLERVDDISFREHFDVLSLNNSRFGDFVDLVYPIELEIKDTTDTDRSASYLDFNLIKIRSPHLSPYAGAAGMLLHINGKFTMGKLKSSLLS
jgi:hypothetical protein